MLNHPDQAVSDATPLLRAQTPAGSARRVVARPGPHDAIVKSATRALEIIELFAVHRHPLSVTEIAGALDIPQSSSSVLLQAMSKAGFMARDRRTRKYLPSIRSVFLGNWMHDALFRNGSVLRALDALSAEAAADVRLGLRNGLHVQYVHVSWPGGDPEKLKLHPGQKVPICRDALGRMLLAAEDDREVRGVARHAQALGEGPRPCGIEAFLDEIRRSRSDGRAECADETGAADRVLAMQLPAQFGVVAAIGLGLAVGRLPRERERLLTMLDGVIKNAWAGPAEDEDHECDISPGPTGAD